ncbi:3-oxoacyl-[acyl-carrier-protein] synthase III C-terminal domain-containing protein [Streptomyces sp. T-3]|nr:3-oxoacyl-[acyl-carrier-protein] synthase III C-terminal domain-containing protein [Streptomyces sp. T-3]
MNSSESAAMPAIRVSPFPYTLTGIAAQLGEIVTMEEWARRVRIPHWRKTEGVVDGDLVRRMLGVESKSWEAARFRSIDIAEEVARQALRSARLSPADLDAVIVLTCTPFEIMLDQDAFTLLRRLGARDDVLPVVQGAGCGGLARAAALVAGARAERALVVSYNCSSPMGVDETGILPHYSPGNESHPYAQTLWTSGGLFSDACSAVVLTRDGNTEGRRLYSRDSQSFGERGEGFGDSLVHYPGGGVNHPVGQAGSNELCAFGMNSDAIKAYYEGGMRLNHQELSADSPGYEERVARIYTHQASPALVEKFWAESGLPLDKMPSHARHLGNLVTSATPVLCFTDVLDGRIGDGEPVCFSVVGAGPERGAFLVRVRIEGPVTPTEPRPHSVTASGAAPVAG